MKIFVKFAICVALSLNLSALDLPSPLKGQEFEKTLKKYYAASDEMLEEFEAHRFDKVAAFDKLYCEEGLTEACIDLGVAYAFGLGVKRDIPRAKEYIAYYADNSPMKFSARTLGSFYLEVIEKTSNLDEKGAIAYLSDAFKKEISECETIAKWESSIDKNQIKKDYLTMLKNRDSCFKAILYTYMLPCNILASNRNFCSNNGLDDDVLGNILLLEIRQNGVLNSKYYKMFLEKLDYLESDEIKIFGD